MQNHILAIVHRTIDLHTSLEIEQIRVWTIRRFQEMSGALHFVFHVVLFCPRAKDLHCPLCSSRSIPRHLKLRPRSQLLRARNSAESLDLRRWHICRHFAWANCRSVLHCQQVVFYLCKVIQEVAQVFVALLLVDCNRRTRKRLVGGLVGLSGCIRRWLVVARRRVVCHERLCHLLCRLCWMCKEAAGGSRWSADCPISDMSCSCTSLSAVSSEGLV